MFFILALTTLVSVASSLPCTEPPTNGSHALAPSNTTIAYYQGSAEVGLQCFVQVGSDVIQAGHCLPFTVNAITISEVPDNNCTFTLFSGSTSCDPNQAEGSATSVVQSMSVIEAGNGTMCIETSVQDGGKLEKASGIWGCG